MAAAYEEELPPPWLREAALTRHLWHDEGCNGATRFHCFDIWHSMLLGVGKSWCASGILLFEKVLIRESNINLRLQFLTGEYKAFCKRKGIPPYIKKIDTHMLGGAGSEEQTAAWNKASVTANVMMFLEDFLSKYPEQVAAHETIRIFVSRLHWMC